MGLLFDDDWQDPGRCPKWSANSNFETPVSSRDPLMSFKEKGALNLTPDKTISWLLTTRRDCLKLEDVLSNFKPDKTGLQFQELLIASSYRP